MRQALARAAAVTAILSGATLGVAGSAAAAPSVPVTEYADYPGPQHGVPIGCDASRAQGVQFTNSRTGVALPAARFREMVIQRGDAITMTWTSVDPECVGGVLSLPLKRAITARFLIIDNQELVASVTSDPLTGGAGALTLWVEMPPGAVGCLRYFQIDGIVGQPLAIVGPDGSYYGLNGRVNVLLGAANGDLGVDTGCATTSTVPPTTELPPVTVPPTTEVPSTTVPATTTTIVVTTIPDGTPVRVIIPVTGVDNDTLLMGGLILMLLGVALLLLAMPARRGK